MLPVQKSGFRAGCRPDSNWECLKIIPSLPRALAQAQRPHPMLPNNKKSGFRAGFRPDSSRECLKTSSPAGLRAAGGPMFTVSLL